MSYIAATAPTSGPPGPLRFPGGPQLGAVEPHTHTCQCAVGAVDLTSGTGALGLVALAGLTYFVFFRK
jgi:MYXO-CTERM domain-containing protein